MTIIYFLLTCSILIAIAFLIGFLWSVRSGQYDDAETPAYRMLFDDAAPVNNDHKKHDSHQETE